mgnify:CR=1 FL=1
MYSVLLEKLREIYDLLLRRSYRPVIVGSFALILQEWLPKWYLDVTKDIDVYINDPQIVFDTQLESELSRRYALGRSEIGGIYIDTGLKKIEIIYPLYDFYIPRKLLENTVDIEGLRVLEGHSALIAMSLGYDITRYVSFLRVAIDQDKLRRLLEIIGDELEEERYIVARERIERFINTLSTRSRRRELQR